MTIAERGIFNRGGSKTGIEARWGDYSAMSCDPSTNTFWYTQEYLATTSSSGWRARIASFSLSIAPVVATLAATSVAGTSATINGTVNPNGLASTYSFQWGTTTGYGNNTTTLSAGSSTSAIPVSANLTGLIAGTPYHCRVIATNSDGTSNGNDLTFNTLCGVYTLPFSEEFTNTTIPNCWTQVDNQGNGQVWQFGTITGQSPNPILTNNYTYLNSDAYGSGNSHNADLVTPTLNLSGYTAVYLAFSHYFLSYAGSSGRVSYSINNGSTWTSISTVTTTSASNPTAINGGPSPFYQWKMNGYNVGTNSNLYTYVPSNGDVISCTLTSSAICTSSNPGRNLRYPWGKSSVVRVRRKANM